MPGSAWTLFFQFPADGPLVGLSCEPTDTVGILYARVEAKSGMCKEDLIIQFCGKDLLTDDNQLAAYGVSNFCVLHIHGLFRL